MKAPQWQLHKYNRRKNHRFVWKDAETPLRRLSEAQREQYGTRGYFAFEDAFDVELIDRLTAATDILECEAAEKLRADHGGSFGISRADEINFSAHLVLRSAIHREFCQHAVFADLAHDLIGPDVRLYWDQLVYKKPGTRQEFPWHQDNGYTFVTPQQYLTCWVALSDATVQNGCPWVLPGLHRQGTLAHRWTPLGFQCIEDQTGIPVPLRAGSIAVFSSLTPHRTGPNVTDETRKAYIVQFAPDRARVYPHKGDPFDADDDARQFLLVQGGRAVRDSGEDRNGGGSQGDADVPTVGTAL